MPWTEKNIPDLKGKVCIVTGANSGLGFQTSMQLAGKNARIIMACRNIIKAEASRKKIIEQFPLADLEIMDLDLAKFDSVQNFANAFTKKFAKLDLLINNAGIGGFPFSKTTDGFESHFAVNHLGHFLLTGLLIESLKATNNARVVNVSSEMNRIGNHDFADINYEKNKYNKWHAYGRSKFANVLFSNELNRRFRQKNIDALAATAHPGYSNTSFQEKGPQAYQSKIDELVMLFSNTLLAQTDAMGALPTLYAATSSDIRGGDYVGPSFLRVRGYPVKQKARGAAYDAALAVKLWKLSEDLTGYSYEF